MTSVKISKNVLEGINILQDIGPAKETINQVVARLVHAEIVKTKSAIYTSSGYTVTGDLIENRNGEVFKLTDIKDKYVVIVKDDDGYIYEPDKADSYLYWMTKVANN